VQVVEQSLPCVTKSFFGRLGLMIALCEISSVNGHVACKMIGQAAQRLVYLLWSKQALS
jgi:hypothetical protein